MRARWVLCTALLLAGCGTPAAGSSSAPAHTTLSATSTPTQTPTPSLLAEPPLAVITVAGSLAVVDGLGQTQWTVSQATVDQLLGATTTDDVVVRVAGPHVVLEVSHGVSQPGRLAVLDRDGHTMSTVSVEDAVGSAEGVAPDPSGTRWAWSVDDTPASAPSGTSHHGHIVVGGLTGTKRTMASWVAPPGYIDIVSDWTDMGIILERPDQGGCGVGYHNDNASFLVDATTGAISQLFANGQHYGDARRGVVGGFASNPSTILVDGTAYDEPATVASKLFVSPDGLEVGVERYRIESCSAQPTSISTELIAVGSQTRQDIAGCGISGWLDPTHFVCHGVADMKQHIESLQGQPGANLGDGEFEGIVLGS